MFIKIIIYSWHSYADLDHVDSQFEKAPGSYQYRIKSYFICPQNGEGGIRILFKRFTTNMIYLSIFY